MIKTIAIVAEGKHTVFKYIIFDTRRSTGAVAVARTEQEARAICKGNPSLDFEGWSDFVRMERGR